MGRIGRTGQILATLGRLASGVLVVLRTGVRILCSAAAHVGRSGVAARGVASAIASGRARTGISVRQGSGSATGHVARGDVR
jgi:hypothetical protein